MLGWQGLTGLIIVCTISGMKIVYDPLKNTANIEKHGLSFEDAVYLEWDRAYTFVDDRYDYGE